MNTLLNRLQPWLRRLLFLPPIAIGCAVVYFAIQVRQPPERVPEQEQVRVLRVIPVPQLSITPRAVGYGTAQPAQDWAAVAEVPGRIVHVHEELEAGSFIPAGDLLVSIDETDINLAIDRLAAEIEKSKASLAELEAQEANLKESLKIEQQVLEVAEAELKREEKLVQTGAGSTADVDSRKRSVIAERQAVQNIQSSLNVLPAQIASANANIDVANANLAEQQRDLARCKIHAPFACRLGPVDLDDQEYVAAGQQLFTAQSTDTIEVEAQFSVADVSLLAQPQREEMLGRLKQDPLFQLVLDQDFLRQVFNVDATVNYGAAGADWERPAKFKRLREELDAQTRTVGVVVAIDNPYLPVAQEESDVPLQQKGPPPVSGTYCTVELIAEPIEEAIVIPRVALHTNHVFVLDDEKRLRKRAVTIRLQQGELVVVSEGLIAGEQLVISDPTPAIEGMLVSPVEDSAMLEQIRREASGAGDK